jgi:hypothetical protein
MLPLKNLRWGRERGPIAQVFEDRAIWSWFFGVQPVVDWW